MAAGPVSQRNGQRCDGNAVATRRPTTDAGCQPVALLGDGGLRRGGRALSCVFIALIQQQPKGAAADLRKLAARY